MRPPLLSAPALAFIAALWLPGPSLPSAHDAVAGGESAGDLAGELAGTYACEGTTLGGDQYRGTVEIVRHEDTYHLVWRLGEREQQVGIGIARADVLAVSYYGASPGLVLYRIEEGKDGPRLRGEWTAIGASGRVFTETLTRLNTSSGESLTPTPRRPVPPLRGSRVA